MSNKRKDFEIGLVLAGAVSAGAYTAGVMDFLFEALEAWNRAKDKGEDVPQHNVKIKVITGASAGGMTAAMAAVEIRKKATGQAEVKGPSSFRKAWVEMINIEDLLSCDDLNDEYKENKVTGKKDKKPFLSLLNSSIIDKIAKEIIRIDSGIWTPLPYVADDLKLYLGLSNLRGIPYKFDLAGETGFPYEMTSHADYQYIEISRATSEREWEKLKNAAMATGAFPIGLSARIIERSRKEYEKRLKEDGLATSKLMELGDDDNFDFVAVDGGLLNNEPLSWAKAALYSHDPDALEQENKNKQILKKLSEQNRISVSAEQQKSITDQIEALKNEKGRTLHNAIIMVDPFPNINNKTVEPKEEDRGLFNIIGPVLSAMRSQCHFRPEELIMSTSEDIYDRFLVAPIRQRKGNTKIIEKKPLASGFFGGFGGFLSIDFRSHDYYLGRRNCQQFLKYYFSIPVEYITENEIFKDNIHKDYIFTEPVSNAQSVHTKRGERRYPIIPLLGDAINEEPTAEWPTYPHDKYNTFKSLLAERIIRVSNKVIPFATLAKRIFMGLIATLGIISLLHFYQYCTCDNRVQPCGTSISNIFSAGLGLVQLILMLAASVLTIFLSALYVIRVMAKSKLVALIDKYLKDYELNVK